MGLRYQVTPLAALAVPQIKSGLARLSLSFAKGIHELLQLGTSDPMVLRNRK